MIKQRFSKMFYFLGGNCKDGYFQCPETNKCIRKIWICNDYDSCGDGSDELHCNGKCFKILSFI